jgi:hypothetical protein
VAVESAFKVGAAGPLNVPAAALVPGVPPTPPPGSADMQLAEYLRVLPIFRRHLHDFLNLRSWRLDADRMRERGCRRLGDRDPEPGGGAAVDGDVGIQAFV